MSSSAVSDPSKGWFTQAFGDAVADIRSRLVEEGWFGQTIFPNPGGTGFDEGFDGLPSPEHQRNIYEWLHPREPDEPHSPSRDQQLEPDQTGTERSQTNPTDMEQGIDR